ncbi:MAG: alpha/beta fold hydrolase [Cyclobacteriaceae bacterium]|nr:alpha/beta fold hydrolase [Cyclobacteriaceae bacterium]
MKTIVQLIFLFLVSFTVSGQDITGEWSGSFRQVTFVFHIEKKENNYVSTMDLPDRNLMGIQTKSTTFQNGSLHIDGTNFGFEYKGEFRNNNNVIEGKFMEGVNAIPLDLKREKIVLAQRPNRPQEPVKPYPYYEEEVFFENKEDGITLAGTLTLLDKNGSYPAVILITGSGPQNRDEEIFGHKPFLVLADHLTRQGIAVLRYDDRGVNKSTGVFADATTSDFATDVLSAVKYLESRTEIDNRNIGLIGHSEGGIIAPMAANQSEDIAFIILLAGTGIPGSEVSAIQARTLRSFDVPDEDAYEQYVRQAIAIASTDKDVAEVRKELKDFYQNSSMLKGLLPAGVDRDVFINDLVNTRTTPWIRYFYTYNPANELEKVTCPVLSLNGSNDVQVPAEINQAAIRKALEKGGNTDFLVKEFPGLNHFFQESKTGLLNEYATIEQTISPVVLEEIADWIRKHIR